MSIYPDHTYRNNADGTVTEMVSEPGVTRRRTLTPGPWVVDRTDCYCCSCGEVGYGDPYCRNHGFAGQRPCEVHRMSGQADDRGVLPKSVQAHLAKQ